MSRYKLLLTICAIAGFAGTASAALNLTARETFQGVGTLDIGTPSVVGSVSGALYKRAVGPSLAGDTTASGLGWSADLHRSVLACISFPFGAGVLPDSATTDRGMYAVDFWVYIDTPVPSQYDKILFQLSDSGYPCVMRLGLSGTDGLTLTAETLYAGFTVTGSTPYTLAARGWTQIRVAWQQVAGYDWHYQSSTLVRAAGDTSFTEVFETTANAAGAPLDTLQVGSVDSNPSVNMRLGMISAYQLDAWADRTLLDPTVVDPPAGPFSWYVSPATGSDSNDGTTAATAWASVAKLNDESANLGMFSSADGPGTGDTLTIDGRTTPLDLGSNALQIATPALTVNLLGAEPLKAWKDVSAAGTAWTLASGCANTYTTTDSAATDLTGVVIWENDRWMNHPFGADISSPASFDGVTNYSTPLAACDAVPGSFYSDGTNLYLHPFDDTNPATDGKAYTRSRYFTPQGSAGGAAVEIYAPDVTFQGDATGGQVISYTDLHGNAQSFRASLIRKTALARSTDNNPYAGYCLDFDEGSGGTCKVANVAVDYFSKHGMGRTTTASNMSVARQYVSYGQGTPYVNFGGQTQDVDFCDIGTGNSWSYDHCVSAVNTGVIGSAAGAVDSSEQSWISHAGSDNNFSGGTWTDCSLCSVFDGLGGTVGPITITGTSFGGGSVSCTTNVDQCRITLQPFTIQAPGQTLTVTNTINTITDFITADAWSQLTGNLVLRGVTIDMRGNTAGSGKALLSKGASASVTMENVLFMSDPAKDFALLSGFASTDTIAMDHNAYLLGPGGYVALAFTDDADMTADRTLVQWQALGEDLTSFVIQAATSIDASLRPIPGSPLADGGTDLGSSPDYTGAWFTHRMTVGAYEAPPDTFAKWQEAFFTPDELNDGTVSGDMANPAGDGVVNLLKYAFNLDPGSVAPPGALPALGFDGTTFALTYTRSLWAEDLTYTVEQSPDLINWTASSPADTVFGSDGVTEQIEARVPANGSGQFFLRLRVTRP